MAPSLFLSFSEVAGRGAEIRIGCLLPVACVVVTESEERENEKRWFSGGLHKARKLSRASKLAQAINKLTHTCCCSVCTTQGTGRSWKTTTTSQDTLPANC